MTSSDRRPPLLAFGLGWIEGASMAGVLARAVPVPPADGPPCPPQFPLGASAAGLPAGVAATYATLASPALTGARRDRTPTA